MPTSAEARIVELRRNADEADRMARVSPFKADRERFTKIAQTYRDEADRLERRARGT